MFDFITQNFHLAMLLWQLILMIIFACFITVIVYVSVKKKKLNLVTYLQYFFLIVAFLQIALIFRKYNETTDCLNFDWGYKIIMVCFGLSLMISMVLFQFKRNSQQFLIYTPILFILIFILLVLSYRFDYIQIYDQWVGGAKTHNSFTDKGKRCDFFLIKFFKK